MEKSIPLNAPSFPLVELTITALIRLYEVHEVFSSNLGNAAALCLYNCFKGTLNDSLIIMKKVYGQQSIGTVKFPLHIAQSGENSSLSDVIQ